MLSVEFSTTELQRGFHLQLSVKDLLKCSVGPKIRKKF